MKANKKIFQLIKTFRLLIFFFSFVNTMAKGEDSLNTKFSINDPRNPDCPCHKFQQLADKEYQLIQLNKKSYSQKQISTTISQSALTEKRTKRQNKNIFIFRLKGKRKINPAKINFKVHLNFLPVKIKTDKCFTWK
ncbi:MAG: hypothetical protein JWO32_2672 [Bacteroidetes bacterium]|nr:hypothetical protein [Bacteroidota bacterium]